jgi:precorrin-6Y C5,15-methyltransferase (decarboxylating)
VSGARITVIGIGADGWDGLSERARRAILANDEVVGSARQLASLPAASPPRRVWPSPLGPLLDEIVARTDGAVGVLASGDPMQYGIGSTLVTRLGPDAVASGRLRIISQPSAYSMALARLGWPGEAVQLISTVGRPVTAVMRLLQPGRRFIVYVTGRRGAAQLARALTEAGFGASEFCVCEQLGSAAEQIRTATAAEWVDREHDPLSSVAVRVLADRPGRFLPTTPGLPDDAFSHDGQLTKRHVRAVTLAVLAPAPEQLLWDIGAGSGSVGIEWLRAEPAARAVAIERDPERAARIAANAEALGTPALRVLTGAVPEALYALLEVPDAIFIGGGLSTGVLAQAWERLAPGGRIVANAVTIEGERLLLDARQAHGGELVQLTVAHAEPLGGFTAWRSALPITQWAARKA